jgi:hypothetical protein
MDTIAGVVVGCILRNVNAINASLFHRAKPPAYAQRQHQQNNTPVKQCLTDTLMTTTLTARELEREGHSMAEA